MSTFCIGSIAEWLTAFIALGALIFSYVQIKNYKKQGRIELLSDYNKRFCANEELKVVGKYLEKECGLNHHYNVPEPDDHQVEMFMRFFEEIELLINEGAMDEETVYYMFSYYALEFDKKKNKWKRVDYESGNWKIFRMFINRMKRIQDTVAMVNPQI
ncbi:MAG: hypothetical protein IKX65_11465 [Prevotella sp.]|nr:hypothetical protein [Prevotella sp.]